MRVIRSWLRAFYLFGLLAFSLPSAALATERPCRDLVDDLGYPLAPVPSEAALTICRSWVSSNPGDSEAASALAETLARMQNFDESTQVLNIALQRTTPRALQAAELVRFELVRLANDGARAGTASAVATALDRSGKAGNATAAALAAIMYLESKGELRDLARAKRALDQAGRLRSVFAPIVRSRLMIALGEGDEASKKAALANLESAHANRNVFATIALGDFYREGEHVPKDVSRAQSLYHEAAQSGVGVALSRLGEMTSEGELGAPDWAKAAELQLAAAKAADPGGAWLTARAFEIGQGKPRDLDQAGTWYRRAAVMLPGQMGEDYARFALRHGRAGDGHEILAMLNTAADAGNPYALAALAYPSPQLIALGVPDANESRRKAIREITDGEVLRKVEDALREPILSADQPKLTLSVIRGGTKVPPGDAALTELTFLLRHHFHGAAIDRYLEIAGWNAEDPRRAGLPTNLAFQFAQLLNRADGWNRANQPENLPRLEALAEAGFVDAARVLVQRYADVRDPFYNPAKADYFAEIGKRLSPGNGGALRAKIKLGRKPDDLEYLEELRLAVEAGADPVWAGELAWRELEKGGAQANFEVISRLIQRAERAGPSLAGFARAIMQWEGWGGEQNRSAALEALHELALNGVGPAVVRLGDHYAVGAGVEGNGEMARRLYLFDQARSPLPQSSRALARLATVGIGQPASLSEARRWLTEAARRGDQQAQVWLDECANSQKVDCLRAIPAFVAFPITSDDARVVHDLAARTKIEQAALEALPRELRPGQRYFMLGQRLAKLYSWLYRPDDLLTMMIEQIAVLEGLTRTQTGSTESFTYNSQMSCPYSSAAMAMQEVDQLGHAIYFAKTAVNHLQRARQQLEGLDVKLHECFLQTNGDRYRYLADLYVRDGRFAEAEQTLALLKDFEHSEYLRGEPGPQGSAEVALSSAEAALAKRYAQALRMFQGEGREEEARATLAEANSAFRDSLGAITSEAALADTADPREAGELDRSDVVRQIKARLIADLRARFDERTVALHSVVLPSKLHWIVTTSGFQQAVTIDLPQSELRSLVGGYRAELIAGSADPEATAAVARDAYKRIFAPVDEILREVGAEKVMMSLDDALRYLPVAALHDGKDYLVRRYAFSVFRDMSDFRERSDLGTDVRLAAFGMSKGGNGFSPLPAVPQELRSLVINPEGPGFLEGEIKLDDAFDRTALTAAVADDYDAVHVASHFALAPDAASGSALLLGDGQLLSLSDWLADGSLTFLDTKLLALSACQTGLGGKRNDGREIDSLAILAQDAGVPAVLASLWSVGDESTAELMGIFYRRWADTRLDKAQAMQAAQIALLDGKNREYADPFYWAAFFVMGDWR